MIVDNSNLSNFDEFKSNLILSNNESDKGIQYTSDQILALYKLIKWYYGEDEYESRPQVFTLSGYGGTGKSTLISSFTDIIGLNISDFIYCAYTGKAVNVLRSKGVQAVTIHHLIYDVRDGDDGEPIFIKKSKDSVKYELLIIDEYSMIGAKLYEDLLSYGIRIILVGDPGQLMPVMDKSISSKTNPDIVLYEITRQSADSPIIKLATKVRSGTSIGFGALSDKVAVIKRNRNPGQSSLPIELLCSGHFQILCGYNKTRQQLNNLVRKYREWNAYGNNKGSNINEYGDDLDKYPVPGDRVICIANDWAFMITESMCLTNGLMGTVESIHMPEYAIDGNEDVEPLGDLDKDSRRWTFVATIRFDGVDKSVDVNINKVCFDSRYRDLVEDGVGHWFDYSYAITVHKAQGSEWDNVILYYEPAGDSMKWLYTGITRAKESLLLIMD